MNTLDLTPLYRSSIGFDRLAGLLDSALSSDAVSPNYPPYNIEALEDNHYAITLAVAGFTDQELDIKVEKGVLSIRGEKASNEQHNYLHQGIANRSFERKFNLDDHVEVVDASLDNGLLTISLVKEIPEAMKPKTIAINKASKVIEHQSASKSEAKGDKAA
ncbi:Hsp20 family protein [Dasania sp. GY-MA-18]|uniref:Hsp20 family protein n=1 Tax=Dasania phycosphaerae TaxID=2950436 RepID=A0A9J6RI95_9GAMM|nr:MULTISPECIES: Hsp20 family protein [Dasania]MCR8921281.1 Hsp20 family protein [Dasania sp. GY-MA-18]MCZ0863709.1 Hsp20 family protein [Dasania phycosphaerae]MCZ0867437.1 Hsp20 family protein [Dasania phycosphaerae]